MSTTRWNNVPGTFSLELEPGDKMPETLRSLLQPDGGEIVIQFQSSGYYTEGTMYARNGDPGDPPEGDDDRTLVDATLNGVKLDKAVANACFDFWNSEIQEEELNHRED